MPPCGLVIGGLLLVGLRLASFIAGIHLCLEGSVLQSVLATTGLMKVVGGRLTSRLVSVQVGFVCSVVVGADANRLVDAGEACGRSIRGIWMTSMPLDGTMVWRLRFMVIIEGIRGCCTVGESISSTRTTQFWKLFGVGDGTLEPGSLVRHPGILMPDKEERSVNRRGCVVTVRGFID
jgi:hypothetical protein